MRCEEDVLIDKLSSVINFSVRILAVLMTIVILWGVIDLGVAMYKHFITPPYGLLTITNILSLFGTFMAILIAIEIFLNITLYLKEEAVHVKIVIATALMAISRKIIILNFEKTAPEYIWSAAAVILALSIGYWLIVIKQGEAAIETGDKVASKTARKEDKKS